MSDNILNQTIEATQPPILGDSPERSFVPVRDTPPDLGAPADLPASHAADYGAILGSSVGATPTTHPIRDNASIDQHLSLRAEAFLSSTLTQYSKCGLTILMYNASIVSFNLSIKFRFIIPNTLFPFLPAAIHCFSHFKSLLIITPKFLSSLTLCSCTLSTK